MPAFNFEEYLDSKCKNKSSIKEKIAIHDPAGVKKPLKVVLEGSCDATDEAYAALAAAQQKPITTKQQKEETATKITSTRVRIFQGTELAEIILEREQLLQQLSQERLEAAQQLSQERLEAARQLSQERLEAAQQLSQERLEAARLEAAQEKSGKRGRKNKDVPTEGEATGVNRVAEHVNGQQS